jgi:solute carrier family 50 (sugar transporter)
MIFTGFITGLRISAAASAIIMYLSPLFMVRKIKVAQNTQPHSYWPVLAAFGNAFLWAFYGFKKGDILPLFTTNAVGMLLNAYYCSVFWAYEKRRCRLLCSFAAMGVALTVIVWETLIAKDEAAAVENLGFIGMVFCIGMFAAPLSTIRAVFRSKSVKSLPFSIIIANFLTTLLWTLYGLVKDNVYVYGPNGTGMALAVFQICIYRKFRSNSSRVNTRLELANPFAGDDEDENNYKKLLKV